MHLTRNKRWENQEKAKNVDEFGVIHNMYFKMQPFDAAVLVTIDM